MVLFFLSVLVVISLLIDMGQTLDIQNHEGMYEINPILGKHPTNINVVIYFLSWIGIVISCTYYASETVNVILDLLILTIEVVIIYKNYKIGLKL
jgi:hypothetical protein